MILAFTGAGISKASGIPTFDEMGDIRDKFDRTFAKRNPKEYQKIIDEFVWVCDNAQPNDAHYALAEYKVPIITMNIDGLHRKAGSKKIIEVHGILPNIVLYGDTAPNYEYAYAWVDLLKPGDTFLIIGTSFYTNISSSLRDMAKNRGADVVIINDNAEEKVRTYLKNHENRIEPFTDFMKREEDWIEYYAYTTI